MSSIETPASSETGPGSEFAALSRRVRQAGLLRRRRAWYAWRISGTVAALVAGWVLFVLAGDSWWQIAVAVLLAVVFAQLGFLGHDAGHRQIFASRKWNYVLGVACGNLAIGLSYGWWVSKHNRHHAHPNTEGEDPDIMIGVLAFSGGRARAAAGLRRIIFRYQAYLLIPMLLLEGCLAARVQHPRPDPPPVDSRVRSRAAETALLALHFAAYLSVVFLVLSPVKAVVFILVQQGLFGFYLGCSFAPNHKGMPVLAAGEQGRLPATAGADLTQRPGRLADRRGPGRPEPPDRAPPVPVDAPAEPAPRPAPDQGVLRRARAALRRVQPARLLRPGAALPQPGWPSDPVADHRSSNGGSSVRLVITASGSASG